jgi:hypothetical protein
VLTSSKDYPLHVFSNMFYRLPEKVNCECEAAAPYEKMRTDDPELSEIQYLKVKQIQDAYYNSNKFNKDVRCVCDCHDGLCNMYPSDDEANLRVTIAGLECVDFSPLGSQLQLGGMSARKLYLWLADRKKLLEDLIVVECWRDFPYWVVAQDS